MSNLQFTESVVEDAALVWLKALGYGVLHVLEIVPGEPATKHTDPNIRNVILEDRRKDGSIGGAQACVIDMRRIN